MSDEEKEHVECAVCNKFEAQAWRKTLCRNCFHTLSEHSTESGLPADVKKEKETGKERARTPDKGDKVIGKENKPIGKDTGKKEIKKSPSIETIDKLGENETVDKNIQDYSKSKQPLGSNKDISGKFWDEKESTVSSNADNSKSKDTPGKAEILSSKLECKNEIAEKKDKILNKFGLKPVRDESKTTNLKSKFESTSSTMPSSLGELDRKYKTDNGLKGNKTDTQPAVCDKKDRKTERKPATADNKLESKLSLHTTESKGESKVESMSLKIDRKTEEKAKMGSKSDKTKESELEAAPKSLKSPENSPSVDLGDKKPDWRSSLKKKKEEKETETSRQSPLDGTTDKTQSWKHGLRSKAGGDNKSDSSSATSPSLEKSDVKPSWKATKQGEPKSLAKSPLVDNLDKVRDVKSSVKSKEVERDRRIGPESRDTAVESNKTTIKDDKKEMKLQNNLEDKQKSDSEKRKDKADTKVKISEKTGKEPEWKRGLKRRTEDKDDRNAVLMTSNDTADKKPDWRSALKKGADKKDSKAETQSIHESEVKKKLEESVDKISSHDKIKIDENKEGVSKLGSKLASENESGNISKAETGSLISKTTTPGPRAAEEGTGISSYQKDVSSPHIDNKSCWAIDVATPGESDTRAVGGAIEAQSPDITFCAMLLDTPDQSLGASTQVFTNSKIAAAEAAAIFTSSDTKNTNKADAYRSGLSLPLQSLVTDLGQTKSKESLKPKNVAVDKSESNTRQVLSPGQRSPVDIDKDFEKLREELLAMADKCRHLEQENESLRKGIRHEATHDLSKQKQELEGSIKALQEQLKSMEGRCVKLETDNNTLIGSIRADQEKSREKSPSLHSADLENLLTERERMCCELIEENNELKQEIQDIKVEMDEMYDTFRDQEVEEFRELQKELEITAKNCRILQFKLRKAERRNEQIETDRLQYEERLRKLQSQFESEDARAHIQTLEEELKMAKDVSVRLHDELDMVDDKRTKIEEENRHLTDLLEQADRKQFRLEMEVDKLRDQIAELKIELSKTSGNISEEDVKAAKKEMSTVPRQSTQVADLQQLNKDLYDSLERERDLKDQLQFALEEAKMFRKKMADLEEENDNLSHQLKRLSTQKAKKEKSVSENGTDVDDGETFESKIELELQFELTEQELAVVKRRLSEMENENESLVTTISELKQELRLKEEALQIKPKPSSPNEYYEDMLKDKDRELDVLRWKAIEKERDIERLHIKMSSIQTKKGHLRKSKSLDYEYYHMVDLKRQLELTQQESIVLRDRVMLLEGENEKLSMEVHKLSLEHSEKMHILQGLAVAYVETEDDVQLHDKINSLERERECYIEKLADLAEKFTSLTKEHDRSKIRPASTSVIEYLDLISTHSAECEPEGVVGESISVKKVEKSHDSVEIVDTEVKSRDPEQLLNVIDERFSFLLQQVISARRPDNMEESHEPRVSTETKAAEISGSVNYLEQVTDLPPKAETSFDTYSDFSKIQLIEKILDMEEEIEDLRLIVKSKEDKNQTLEEEVRVLDKQLDDLRGEFHRKEMELLTDLDMIYDKNEILSNLLDIVKDRADAAEQELERLAQEEPEACVQETTTLKSRSPSTLSGVSTGSDEVFDLGSSSERSQDQFKKRIASLECLLAEERKKTAALEKRLILAGNEALPSMSDDLKLHLREKELLQIELQESKKHIKIANEEVHVLREKLQKLEEDLRKERSDRGSGSLTPETKRAEIEKLRRECTEYKLKVADLECQVKEDEMTYQLQQHEKILRAEYMAMKVRYETQLESLQKEHLQLLVVVDRLQREKHLDKDIIIGVQKGMNSMKQTYTKDLSRWTDERNILQRHIQEIEEGRELANHLKSQVEELKRKLAEQEIERAELINKMTTERAGWDIKWTQITSRNNQIEEALALMAQSKCKSQDIQHRVESTWENERAEQKRLLMEAHKLAIDLQKQMEERDQAFAEERRKLREEIEAHRKKYETEKADKEKKSLAAQTNESTIKHLTATIEEVNEKHKKDQDSWMKEKAELLRRLAETRRAYSRERRNVEDVLTGLKKLRELAAIVVESETSDPSAPHCVEGRIGVNNGEGAESASSASMDTVVLSDVKHNIDQVILKYVKESLRQIHFAAERLSRPEEYKEEEKKKLRRSMSSSELELLKDEFMLEEPADSRSIYTYHEVIEDLSPYSTPSQVTDCTMKKVQHQQSGSNVSPGSLQSNHIDRIVNEQSSAITDVKSTKLMEVTRTMQQLFAHKLNKPLTSCIIPDMKPRTPSPKPQEHALSAKPTVSKSISIDVSNLNRLSAPPYGSSDKPVSMTTSAFGHYNTKFIPLASSDHLKGESDISNLGTPKIGSLDRLSPQTARRKFFEEQSPEAVTYLSLPERHHRSAALKTRQNLSDLTVVKGSVSDISPAFLSEPLPCIRQAVSLDDNSLHSVIATTSQESLSVLSSERRTASAKEKRKVFRKSQSMDSSPVKSTLARIGINVMSAGAPSGFSPSEVFAALKKKLKPNLKRSQSARETPVTKKLSKTESVPTGALASRAEIQELMIPIDIPDDRGESIPSPSFAESTRRNDTSSHKSSSTAVSPRSVTTSSQSKAPKLKKRSKSVETSTESSETHPIIVPRSTPSGTEWLFSETRV